MVFDDLIKSFSKAIFQRRQRQGNIHYWQMNLLHTCYTIKSQNLLNPFKQKLKKRFIGMKHDLLFVKPGHNHLLKEISAG